LSERSEQMDAGAAAALEAQMRLVADALPVLISYVDAGGRYRFNNKAYEEWFGHNRKDLAGRHLRDVLGESAYEALSPMVEKVLAGERVTGERALSYKDGGDRFVHIEYVPDRRDDGSVVGFFALVQDISEAKRAEQALRESEARFRAMADCAAAPVWVTGPSGIEFANKAFEEVTGLPADALAGEVWTTLIHPDDLPPAIATRARAWAEKTSYGFDARFRGADGDQRWMRVTCRPRFDANEQLIGYVGLAVDFTDARAAELALRELNQSLEARVAAAIAEREHAEEALRQSQKMEAVGQLTGGIAHDFNNLLTVIAGNIDIARRHVGESGEGRVLRALGNAQIGAERAAVLTQRLLAFSRRQPLNPRPVDANKLVSGMGELLHRTLGETIEVETVLAARLWLIEADPNQLENAILNLAVNARDAMTDGGKLTIETANTHLDRAYAARNAGVTAGQYVAICVSDIGSGMAADTLERAFEPFFTTKEVGKGTGLGLSMVYGFVKQSGGHLKIYSEEGEGTTVRIYLPRLVGEAAAAEDQPDEAVPEGSREETILVCEDDDDVRAYTVEVLRELGYRVLEAHDGPSALRLLERQEGNVDLLFTDVVLPSGMSGAVLAQEARARRPELRILFTTGYARNAIVHHGRLDPGVELITKPFAYADLAARVRDMLDRT
jgi:PAS domain S-box-containing protein